MQATHLPVLVFGIGKDIMGGSNVDLSLDMPTTVSLLKAHILDKFPAFEDVRSLAIAVNNTYATGDDLIKQGDEVAIIPPVSGG